MEITEQKKSNLSGKRKHRETTLNDLHQDLLERVLSRLPPSSFFRLTPVCKRWKSAASSATFNLACSEVPSRDPWFLMVPSHPGKLHRPTVVFDSSENDWKKLNDKPIHEDLVPVASAAGFICFRGGGNNDLTVTNPVTASSRIIPDPGTPVLAVAMAAKSAGGFDLLSVSGEIPNLSFRRYCSVAGAWEQSVPLSRKFDESVANEDEDENDDVCTRYFLSKSGDVVTTDIQRSPSKQFSSVFTVGKNGDEILHFLSASGTVVACNLTRRFFFEYPRILPVFSEYSIDLVVVGGEMRVVLLSEFLETAGLRVWKWDDEAGAWGQVAAMPPSMSHGFYGKKVDINCCTGVGGRLLVCVNSEEVCSYFRCDLGANDWVELPECRIHGEVSEFVSAVSFEPRVEASVWGIRNRNS